jgi:hypothetical protein
MTLHLTQIFFTDARTFITAALLRAQNPGTDNLFALSALSSLRLITLPRQHEQAKS